MTTLQLGAGNRPLKDALNHDRTAHAPHIDIAHDLDCLPWPFPTAEFDRVIALDVMEHLRLDVQEWLDECWRILKDGGELVLRVPSWNSPVGWRDPTHRRLFHEETFHYWDRRMALHRDYGAFYFGEGYAKWWEIQRVERTNPPTATGDLGFVLKKVTE